MPMAPGVQIIQLSPGTPRPDCGSGGGWHPRVSNSALLCRQAKLRFSVSVQACHKHGPRTKVLIGAKPPRGCSSLPQARHHKKFQPSPSAALSAAGAGRSSVVERKKKRHVAQFKIIVQNLVNKPDTGSMSFSSSLNFGYQASPPTILAHQPGMRPQLAPHPLSSFGRAAGIFALRPRSIARERFNTNALGSP